MISIQGIVLYSILLVLYYLVPKQWQKHLLLAADLLFAFSLGISTLVMLIILSLIVFFGVRGMADSTNKKSRVFVLVMAVVLALFGIKYLSFFAEEITVFLGHFGIVLSPEDGIKPVQAVGISFYSLRLIGYTVDVYKGQKEERDILNFLLFTSFFPIFTAGPIEKSSRLMTEVSCYRAFDEQKVYRGFLMTLYGVFLKLVVADRLGVLVDEVYNDIDSYPGALCLIVIILYSFQIYADFAGYSHIAIGLSGMLGIGIMENFRRPYLAVSVRDFWRRWHISLSEWLRDYIYIPLGGSRKGSVRKELNILITFLISGLWHGTGLNFIVWGGLHGIYQVIEDMVRSKGSGAVRKEEQYADGRIADDRTGKESKGSMYSAISHAGRILCTFILVTVAWVFFRADSVSQALTMFGKIIEGPGFKSLANGEIFNLGLGPIQIFGLLAALVIIAVFEVMQEKQMITLDKITASPRLIRWTVSYIMIVWIVIAAVQLYGITEEAAFIYAAF